MNYRMIRNILGWILMFEAGFLLVPSATAIVYGEWWEMWHFLATALLCLSIGGLMAWQKPKDTTLYAREGFVIVSLSWMVMSLFGAIPFFTTGHIPSFIDALFEMVSGFTTTGSSILTSVADLPKSINMWRCFSHWVGGMGVLVFIMAFVSLSGGQNMHIMKAESPGPSVGKLVPRVKTTAAILYSIYLVLTFLLFIFLLFGDMTPYESLCTAFGTAGTGGFGIRNDSLASFSAYSQIVVTVFMLLFSINFGCYYLLLLGRIKEALNVELRRFIYMVVAAIAIVTLNVTLVTNQFTGVGEALRHVSFTVASIVSTTGFVTVDFALWPNLALTLIVCLTFVGACAGSTGGGFKVSRLYILMRGAFNELGNLAHPHRVKKVTMDKRPVDSAVLHTANVYLVWYMLVIAVSVILISFEGKDLVTNFTAVVTTVNNVGPGLGLVGPTGNFACFSVFSKIILIFDMLIGRLELFPVLLLFTPSTWRK